MITSLNLHNFKAFDELQVNLRPITLILGPNNSGKSSILSVVRLLVQTIASRDPDVPLLLNGVMGDLGTYKDIVYLNHRGRPLEIGFSILIRNRAAKLKDTLKTSETGSYQWDIGNYYPASLRLTYKYRSVRRELILESCELKRDHRLILSTKYSEDSEKQVIVSIAGKEVPSNIRSSFSKYLRMRNFIPSLSIIFETEGVLKDFLTSDIRKTINNIGPTTREVIRTLETTDYIGAMRVPPMRIYTYTGERRRRVGAAGENAANIISMDNIRKGKSQPRVTASVSEWLSNAKIASDFKVVPNSDSFYEIRVQHPETKEYENLADVGLGNSQIMPILVGGYNLYAGDTYLVEEPEIHLHPKAQAELGGFFLNLYHRGVQSIVETHSEHLVIRLQQYVADNKISPKDVQFLYVYAENGKKVVKSLELDEFGIFTQEWPGGFFPERLEEAKKLVRIRSSSMKSEV